MSSTENLEYANNSGFLWPPIADALDTFLRRRHRGSAPFERIWRLIHVWEGVAITLAIAGMARIRASEPQAHLLLRQREFFYGKSWDPVTESFKKLQGAADGAIDQWVNILDEIAKSEDLDGLFLPALKKFLNTEVIDVSPLSSAWSKACDMPTSFQPYGKIEIRKAIRYVNTFRNRFAHVPFPHDPLEDIASALETATEMLFSVPPIPSSQEKDGSSSPLTGAFRMGQCFWRGSQLNFMPQADTGTDLEFVFPCKKNGNIESWPTSFFVHIDSMDRPHILTRVKGNDICEYTRFRAEANAVLVLPNSTLSACLPEPDKNEYMLSKANTGEDSTNDTREPTTLADALEAIRNNDFDTGIEFFSELVKKRPEYHVAWLRLGHARREKAARLAPADTENAKQLLFEALNDLDKATSHVDASYKALAHYERSKTAYRIAHIQDGDTVQKTLALQEAIEACKLSPERKYQTWLDYLNTYGTSTNEPIE